MNTSLFPDLDPPPAPSRHDPVVPAAWLSDDGRYRYRLDRTWDTPPPLTFVMLNPSTADANEDDPTIRRCIGFAEAHACGGIVVVNLFALRSPDPTKLLVAANPVGPDNTTFLAGALAAASTAHSPVCAGWGAWGAMPAVQPQVRLVERLAAEYGVTLACLGLTAAGHPRHPLYLPSAARLEPWKLPA